MLTLNTNKQQSQLVGEKNQNYEQKVSTVMANNSYNII